MTNWQIKSTIGKTTISTVELPFKHNGGLYETCLFTSCDSFVVQRYETKDDAIEGHDRWIERIKIVDSVFPKSNIGDFK